MFVNYFEGKSRFLKHYFNFPNDSKDAPDTTYSPYSDERKITIVQSGFVQTDGDILGGSIEFNDHTFWGFIRIVDHSKSVKGINIRFLVLKAVENEYLKKNDKLNDYHYDCFIEYYPKEETPYELHLYGNDDGDWCKFYSTKSEAYEDLDILAKKPLTFDMIRKLGLKHF